MTPVYFFTMPILVAFLFTCMIWYRFPENWNEHLKIYLFIFIFVYIFAVFFSTDSRQLDQAFHLFLTRYSSKN